MSACSVADVTAFEALPDEVQALARKVLTGGHSAEKAALAKAYKDGWEDGVEQCEIERPYLSDKEAEEYAERTLKVTT